MPFKNLPDKANRQWEYVYNSSLESGDDESTAAAKAWGVVKKKYVKKGDKWVKKQSLKSNSIIESINEIIKLVGESKNIVNDQSTVSNCVYEILYDLEEGNLSIFDAIDKLKDINISDELMDAVRNYEIEEAEDRLEWGMRGGLEESARDRLIEALENEVKNIDMNRKDNHGKNN